MSTYLHQRLSKTLLRELSSGSWRDGQRFLSVRDIERLWQVSEPTIIRSLNYLIQNGLLRPKPRSGYFTTTDFQSKSQLLLKKNAARPLPPPLTWQQKARQLHGELGGKIALLFEAFDKVDPYQVYSELPEGDYGTRSYCARAFAKESKKYNFILSHFFHNGKEDHAQWIRSQLNNDHFAGAAVFCRSNHTVMLPLLQPLLDRHLPIVIMYDDCQGLPVNSINLNNVGIGYDAIRQLSRMGHKRITVLTPKHKTKLHEDRVKGCLLALSEDSGKKLQIQILKINPTSAISAEIKRHFAQTTTRPTAVFSTQSSLVKPLFPLWKSINLSIPDNLSLLVCSRKSQFTNHPVPLDTMQLNLGSRIGRTAAQQLHRIQTGEALEKSILFNVKYVKRGSIRLLTPPNNRQTDISLKPHAASHIA